MQTFDQALYDLYKAGKITLDEALRNSDSANNLRLRVKLSEEGLDERKKGGAKPARKPDGTEEPLEEQKLRVDIS